MRIGILDYLLRCRDSVLLHTAREVGYDAVELSIDRFGDPSRILFDPERADELIRAIRATGVAISSLFATQFLTQNLLDADPTRRRSTSLIVRGLAETASAVGIEVVVLPLLSASRVAGEAEQVALAELLPLLGKWGENFDISFAIKLSSPGELILPLMEGVAPQRVGFSFDPALYLAIGYDPVEEWRMIHSRTLHVHLGDRTMDGIPKALGEGDVPIRELVKLFVEDEFPGPIIVQAPAGEKAKDSARRHRVYLERLLTTAHLNRSNKAA